MSYLPTQIYSHYTLSPVTYSSYPVTMSYECADCNRSFNTDRGVLAHCRAKGHDCYQCDLCDDEDIVFKNEDQLDEVSRAVSYD